MKLIHFLCFVLILLCYLHEVADGQSLANTTGTPVSANVNGTKVTANVTTTKTPDGPALTNSTGTKITNTTGSQASTNTTGSQASTNSTGSQASTNSTGSQASTSPNGTQVSTNTNGTQVSTNSTGTQVSSTQKPAGTLLVEGGTWSSGTYKKPQWPWKGFHYVVTLKEPDIGDPLHKNLEFAMGDWGFSSCIEFVFAKDEKTDLVFKRGTECSVDYGTPGTPSVIHVNDGCISTRHIHHFLGHYLGLFDEQRRPDRDEYIEVLQKDLPPATQKLMSKFDSSQVKLYSTMYDLSSVMHMSPRSMDDGDKAIFRTKDPKLHGIPGRVKHPSHWDFYRVNAIHGCQEKLHARCEIAPNTCKNRGFLTHFCVCLCPPGTNGTYCEHVTGHPYEDVESTCSEVVTKNLTTVVAGNFRHQSSKTTWCLFQVKAPEHHQIMIAFDFTESNETINKSTRCQGSLVSITEVSLQQVEENVICGEEFRKLHIYFSKTNEVDIYYDVRETTSSRGTRIPRGFKATITFHGHGQDNSTVNATESTTTTKEVPVPTTTMDYDDDGTVSVPNDYDDATTLSSPIKDRTSAVSTTGKTTTALSHTEASHSHRTTTTAGSVAGLPVMAGCNRDAFLCIVQYFIYSLIFVHLFHL
ncbi:blastula protease 10-like [Macrobrachium nipponense]|uniref:blastula protease 10-like n=1 Tax=Macrobrachium nipponense TaxID=159736 RepID=UPI0030C88F62